MIIYDIRNKGKLNYADNQAIIFTGVGKNVALIIGVIIGLFGTKGHLIAMYPALILIFQIISLMIYLQMSEFVEKCWRDGIGSTKH